MPLEVDNLLTYGKFNEVGFVVDVQFVHQTGFVPLYGFRADDEHIGYFSGSMPLSYQFKHFSFSIGQLLIRVFSPLRGFLLTFFNERCCG
jgi:hypothetical protein